MPTKSDKSFIFNYPDTPEYREFIKKYQSPGHLKRKNEKIPEIAIPFQNLGWIDLNCLDYLEHTFCAIFLFIPRILIFIITILLFIILGKIAVIGIRSDNQKAIVSNSCWRKFLAWLCLLLVRANAFFCFGIYWISRKGTPASQNEAPIRLMVPHSSYMDALIGTSPFPLGNMVSFIMKADSTLGQLIPIEVVMAVRVYRNSEQKKDFVTEELQRRAKDKDGGWWPIVLSPEGTALTGTVLHKFKLGAFKPGLPVQPVYFKVKGRGPGKKQDLNFGDNYGDRPVNMTKVLLCHMLKLWQTVSIEYLEPIVPTQDEQYDAVLFADNCRQKISEITKIPIHDTTLEDGLLSKRFAHKYGGDPNYGIVKFVKLQVLYSANFKVVKSIFDTYLTDYKEHLDKKTGSIPKAKFLKLFEDTFGPNILTSGRFKHFFGDKDLDLPETLALSDAIELLVFQVKFSNIKTRLSMTASIFEDEPDLTGDGTVYHRDTIIGMELSSEESENEDTAADEREGILKQFSQSEV